jgi:hypothetical protein
MDVCIYIYADGFYDFIKKIEITTENHEIPFKTVVLLPTGDLISIRPRADVVKHKRETDSQYQIRYYHIFL